MIYDLEELNRDNNLLNTEFGNPISEREILKVRVSLAIAERLDALIDAVKRTSSNLITLTTIRDGEEFDWLVNPRFVSSVFPLNTSDKECAVVMNNYVDEEYTKVKGTVAEVTAKLRGEV